MALPTMLNVPNFLASMPENFQGEYQGETEEIFRAIFSGRVFARLQGLEAEALVLAAVGAMQAKINEAQNKKYRLANILVETAEEYPTLHSTSINKYLLGLIASGKIKERRNKYYSNNIEEQEE